MEERQLYASSKRMAQMGEEEENRGDFTHLFTSSFSLISIISKWNKTSNMEME